MARVLVTGGAGFIGSHVVRALRAAGHEVRVFDLAAGDDVRRPDQVGSALAGMDAVCHHAATVGMGMDCTDLPRYASHNDFGTAVLLAEMYRQGVRALVLASSMVVYGEGSYRCAEHGSVPAGERREADLRAGRFDPPCPRCAAPLQPGLVTEDAPLDPRSIYAATKVAQEHLACAWARQGSGRAVDRTSGGAAGRSGDRWWSAWSVPAR